MISFSSYLKKNMVRRTTHYFAIIFVLLNISMYFVNSYYKEQSILQKEEAFSTIVLHISTENEFSYVIEYIEHYGHIHRTAVRYYHEGALVFDSIIQGDEYTRYDIGDSGDFIMVDSSKSPNSLLSTSLIIVSNVIFILIYIVSMFLFYRYSDLKSKVIVRDLDEMLYNINEKKFIDHQFSFTEYQTLYDQFRAMYRELTDSRLLKANKLQSITHDLKTSLTVLQTYIEGAKHNRIELNEERLNQLLDEVKYNNSLVESLRNDYLKEYVKVNISELLGSICDKYESIYETKKIDIKRDIEKDLFIEGDVESLTRIIQNILSNSFYYSNSSTTVSVSLTNVSGVQLKISDQGVGISNDDIENIFKKNYRVSNSMGRNKKGNGLGLYIVKLLLDDLGARIDVESNEGTTVTVTFSS